MTPVRRKRVSIDETRNEVYLDSDRGMAFAFRLRLSRQNHRLAKAPRSDELWDGDLRRFRERELSEDELLVELMQQHHHQEQQVQCEMAPSAPAGAAL